MCKIGSVLIFNTRVMRAFKMPKRKKKVLSNLMQELLWPRNRTKELSFKKFFRGWKGSYLNVKGGLICFLKVFKHDNRDYPPRKGFFLCWRAVGQITRAPVDSLCSHACSWQKLHHDRCLLFTLIYLDCDNRGLTDSRGIRCHRGFRDRFFDLLAHVPFVSG